MAVDTHSRHLGVLYQRSFVKIVYAALKEPHLAIHFIPWRNTPIGKSVVSHLILADLHCEILIPIPSAVFFCADRECQHSSLVSAYEVMPLVDIKVGIVALMVYHAFFASLYGHVNLVHVVCDVKVHWRDVGWDSHSTIVGKDSRQLVHFHRIVNRFGTCRQQHRHRQ